VCRLSIIYPNVVKTHFSRGAKTNFKMENKKNTPKIQTSSLAIQHCSANVHLQVQYSQNSLCCSSCSIWKEIVKQLYKWQTCVLQSIQVGFSFRVVKIDFWGNFVVEINKILLDCRTTHCTLWAKWNFLYKIIDYLRHVFTWNLCKLYSFLLHQTQDTYINTFIH
jgi:hypothetical protein